MLLTHYALPSSEGLIPVMRAGMWRICGLNAPVRDALPLLQASRTIDLKIQVKIAVKIVHVVREAGWPSVPQTARGACDERVGSRMTKAKGA